MSFQIAGTVIGIGSSLINGSNQADASRDAAATQSDAAKYASDQQMAMFDKANALQQPWRDAGAGALSQINQLLNSSEWRQPFGMAQFQADPGYQFRMSEGQKGLDRRALAGGKFFSGGALKDMSRFNQDLASNEYQNAFNRFSTDRSNRLNPLMSMAGFGQQSAQSLGNMGMTTAGQIGNNAMMGASANAAGIMGSANANTNTMNSIYGILRGMPQFGTGRVGGNAPISVSTPTFQNEGWQGGDWG